MKRLLSEKTLVVKQKSSNQSQKSGNIMYWKQEDKMKSLSHSFRQPKPSVDHPYTKLTIETS